MNITQFNNSDEPQNSHVEVVEKTTSDAIEAPVASGGVCEESGDHVKQKEPEPIPRNIQKLESFQGLIFTSTP